MNGHQTIKRHSQANEVPYGILGGIRMFVRFSVVLDEF